MPATLAEISQLLKEIRQEVERQKLSPTVYYLLVNAIGKKYVQGLPEDGRTLRFKQFLKEVESFPALNSFLGKIDSQVTSVLAPETKVSARIKEIRGLIAFASTQEKSMPDSVKTKPLFTGYGRLHADNADAEKVLETTRMLNRMLDEEHQKKYTSRSAHLSWIKRRFKRGVPATLSALKKELKKLEVDVSAKLGKQHDLV